MTFGAVIDPVIRSECGFAASSFVGRRGEMLQIRQQLTDYRLITLTGPGGVGKSRLAHRLAVTLRRAYQDRVHCVDLVDAQDACLITQELQDPNVLAHLVATAIGLGRDGGTSMAELAASLAEQPRLLLLDNCERLLPACAVLADALLRECPQLHILAASREPLRLDAEVVHPVQPLPTPPRGERANVAQLRQCESVALFVSRAEAVSDFELSEENAPAVAELCRRLDGLPLAIELAAARTRALAPAQIVQRSGDRFALLSRGSRSAPQRQQNLRASVDWSFDLCSKPEQQLWGRLSVFPGAFELDAVEGVCADDSLPASAMLDLVAGLVNKSILISECSGDRLRYRMLETYRDYGREKLIEGGGRDELRRRHRDWYERLVRRTADDWFSPRQADWFARLGRELPNLRTALTYSLAANDGTQAALEMAAGLWPLWAVQGRHSEGRRSLDQALARTTGATMCRIEALCGYAVLAAVEGDLGAVRACVRQCHEVAAELDDGRAYAIAACADGFLATANGDPAEAARAWRAAIDGFAVQRATSWRAVALTGLGMTMAMFGDADLATRCHDELVALGPPDGEWLMSGVSLGSLGLALWKAGDLNAAADRLRESVRRLRRVDDQIGIARCLRVLARIACDERRADRAATLLGAADGLGRAVGVQGAFLGLLSVDDEEAASRTKAALGEQAYRAAFARGVAMSVDEAIAFGLDERCQSALPMQDQPTPLTRRELQVAELVAQGQSNKDIAATLVISRRTAESHVERILTKLGLTNRAQVAAWMVRRSAQRG